MTINGATLSKAMGGQLSTQRYSQLADDVNTALKRAGCTTVNRAAMFLAQIRHESNGLKWMQELASGAEYEGWTSALGNTQKGDGVRFKGRGPLQVTGRQNYTNLSKWAKSKGYVPTADYFVKNPAKLAEDQYGFLGAVWFWTTQASFNAMSDRGDVRGVTRAINGPAMNGLAERTRYWNAIRPMGNAILPGKVLTKQKTIKVGDTARVVKAPAPGRKAPGGAFQTSGGKKLVRKNGFQFKVTKLAKAKGGKVIYARTNKGTWYATNRLAGYREI